MRTLITLLHDVTVLFQRLTLHQLSLDTVVANWATYKAGHWGNNPTPPNPYELVRISWQRGGAPSWGVTEDVAFLRATTVDSPYFLPDTVYSKHTDVNDAYLLDQKTVRAALLQVYYSFYGPNSFDNAQLVRDTIKYQENHDILARGYVYIVPKSFPVRRVPEEYQGQWWERADIEMLFNWTISRTAIVNAVKSVDAYIQPNGAADQSVVIT